MVGVKGAIIKNFLLHSVAGREIRWQAVRRNSLALSQGNALYAIGKSIWEKCQLLKFG